MVEIKSPSASKNPPPPAGGLPLGKGELIGFGVLVGFRDTLGILQGYFEMLLKEDGVLNRHKVV